MPWDSRMRGQQFGGQTCGASAASRQGWRVTRKEGWGGRANKEVARKDRRGRRCEGIGKGHQEGGRIGEGTNSKSEEAGQTRTRT